MNNYWKIRIILNKQLFKYLSVGFIITLINFIYALNCLINNKYMSNLFLQQWGSLAIDNKQYIMEITIYLINHFYLLYILGGETRRDISEFGSLIFTRTNKRSRWLLNKYIKLFIYIFIYYMFEFISTFGLGVAFGLQLGSITYLSKVIFLEILAIVFNGYLVVILSNVISMIIDTLYSYIFMVLFEAITLFYCHMIFFLNLNNTIIKYLPFTQGILTWHDTNLITSTDFNIHIKNFSLIYSNIYVAILISITMICGMKTINKKDIL